MVDQATEEEAAVEYTMEERVEAAIKLKQAAIEEHQGAITSLKGHVKQLQKALEEGPAAIARGLGYGIWRIVFHCAHLAEG